MAWKDSSETIVGTDGQIYTAPVGTALPTTAAATLSNTWSGFGFHAESGITVSKAFDIAEFKAWQALRPIRRERQTEDLQLSCELLQWNELTVPLAFGGGAVISDGGTGYRYNPPADEDAIEERSLVADIFDGTRKLRFVIERGSITEGNETQFTRTELATLKVTFKTLEPTAGGIAWYLLTNDAAAFAVGS